MPIFKLIKDECFESWWRNYYEIKAETLEEAAELVKNNKVDPYNTEMLSDLMQTPIGIEIYDENGILLN